MRPAKPDSIKSDHDQPGDTTKGIESKKHLIPALLIRPEEAGAFFQQLGIMPRQETSNSYDESGQQDEEHPPGRPIEGTSRDEQGKSDDCKLAHHRQDHFYAHHTPLQKRTI